MKYTFKEMLDDAKRAGLTSDKVMMRSAESMSELLCLVKEEHPELYWKFMREQHGIMYGNHYNEAFAMFDVGMMRYIDRDGKKCEGAHWTAEQIEASTRMMGFPAGTTKWDKYVAFNAFYSDLCTVYNDEQIIKGAHKFYFEDQDWGGHNKDLGLCVLQECNGLILCNRRFVLIKNRTVCF